MLLENKNAVIYGAGGAVGGAVARAFAREGARVFLTGRNLTKVETVAKDIIAAGGKAEIAQVDALDEGAVEEQILDGASGWRSLCLHLQLSSGFSRISPTWPHEM